MIKQWDEIATTYRRERWNPGDVLSALENIDNKLKDLRAAVRAAGVRANEWIEQISNGDPRDLTFYDKRLHELEEHLEKTITAVRVMKPPPHRPKTGIAGPNSRPSDWFAAEVYAVVRKCGGTLTVNKDGKGARDYPKGRFHAFLERMKDYLPREVSVPASPRALDRIKTEMDKKLRQLACS